jgi:hypothetical protein
MARRRRMRCAGLPTGPHPGLRARPDATARHPGAPPATGAFGARQPPPAPGGPPRPPAGAGARSAGGVGTGPSAPTYQPMAYPLRLGSAPPASQPLAGSRTMAWHPPTRMDQAPSGSTV